MKRIKKTVEEVIFETGDRIQCINTICGRCGHIYRIEYCDGGMVYAFDETANCEVIFADGIDMNHFKEIV